MSTTAKETQTEKTNELADFAWDNSTTFFGTTPVKDEDEEVEEETSTETETETETSTETKDEKGKKSTKKTGTETDKGKKVPEPFEEITTEETVVETAQEAEGNKGEGSEDDVKFFTTLAKEMKERKIFQTVEVPETIDENQFFELQDEEIENRFEETVQGFINELNDDEDGVAFLKFKKAGGKTSVFFQSYAKSSQIPEVDLTKEEDQDKFLRFYYREVEKLDDEDVEDKLSWLKDVGKKKSYAEKYNTKIVEADKATKAKLLSDQEEAQKTADTNRKNFVATIKTTLDSTEQVGAFTFNKTDKKELTDYVTKPAVKVTGNKYITQLQADLNTVFSGDKQKLLLLAKLIKNDFDIADVVTDLKTKVVKETKSNIKLQSTGLRPSSSSSSKNKDLASYF